MLPRSCLLIGGEASSRSWVQELQLAARNCAVFNHYGPTETTVGVLMHPVEADRENEGPAIVPIGKPIANTISYCPGMSVSEPVPAGIAGELCIGGTSVARGYLNRPALTAEKFVPHPFSKRPGERIYRRGVRLRQGPDGTTEFILLEDHQVKIRGYRIELGEIETALVGHPSVRQCAVAARC